MSQIQATEPSSATLAAISFEYSSICRPSHCPTGVYVIPSSASPLIWDGVLFVHQGYYASAILKFRLSFPQNYPERPPEVNFITDVFHPLVSQRDGLFSLAPRFASWRPKDGHVFDILFFLKTAFKKHALDNFKESDCLNKEAFRLYRESTASFAALATQSSLLSQSDSALYDKDHPAMGGKGKQTFVFHETRSEILVSMRERLGLKEWTTKSGDVETASP